MKYIAVKRLKVGNKIIKRGEEIKNFRFFKRQNKSALLNMGWVMQMEDSKYEEYLKEMGKEKTGGKEGNTKKTTKSKRKAKIKSKENTEEDISKSESKNEENNDNKNDDS